MAVSGVSTRRRESASMWFKQLLIGQEQQGTAKAAAAAWLGTIYALRAASRIDGNKDWGRTGDEMIGLLENAYLTHMGKDATSVIDAGRRLLRTDEAPQAPKALNVPREAVKPIHVDLKRPVMPKLKPLPRIKVVRPKALAGKKVKVTLKRVKARR